MTRRPQLAIRTRLTLWYAAVFLATGATLLIMMYLMVSSELVAANSGLVSKIVVAQAPTSAARPTVSPGASAALRPVPSDTMSPAVCPAGGTSADQTCAPHPTSRPAVTAVAVAVAVNDSRRDVLRAIIAQSGLAFVAMAALAVTLCWLVAGRALLPLRKITGAAARLSQETLDSRIALEGPADELKTLADTFDGMLDRLGRAFETQQLFAANASHELRTPLTIIQTAAEKALSRPSRTEAEYRKALTIVSTAAQRSERLLASLLYLAQTQREPQTQPLDLATAAREVTAAWPQGGPVLHRDLSEAPVSADPVMLGMLLRNLLDNAARYNVPDGAVWVTTSGGDRSILRVENTGPRIDPADLPSLRQSFQRGAHRTSTGTSEGFGLGLAIVDSIVAAHRGTWSLAARDDGGLIVTVSMGHDATQTVRDGPGSRSTSDRAARGDRMGSSPGRGSHT